MACGSFYTVFLVGGMFVTCHVRLGVGFSIKFHVSAQSFHFRTFWMGFGIGKLYL